MKVLLLCASHNDLGLIKGLKKLGVEIVVTGKIPGQLAEKYADKYICEDYSNFEKILNICKEEKIDRICACCNDFGVYTAVYVAEKLGMPGYDSYDTICLLHNKDRFKEYAKKINLSSPWTESFNNKESAAAFLKEVKFPVIIKPVDASAGNGIMKVNSIDECQFALDYAFSKTREGRIVIEQYITGTQHGFCTFLHNQKVVAVSSNNEYSIANPYRVEIDTYPADDYEKYYDYIVEQIELIAKDLKLVDGIFHLQYIVCDGKPYIIEVMRRAIGNMYSIPADLLNGIQWDYWEARAQIGLDCNDFPAPVKQIGNYAYKAILAEQNGTIESITIPEEYNKYLVDKVILKNVGDKITNYKSEPIGLLFFMFRTKEEMKKVLIESYRNDLVKIN